MITEPVYRIEVLAATKSPISTLSAFQIVPTNTFDNMNDAFDTLLIPGGLDPHVASRDSDLLDWIRNQASGVRRLASVCNGAFVLAGGGLLDGCRVTTHGGYSKQLADDYPLVNVRIQPDFCS